MFSNRRNVLVLVSLALAALPLLAQAGEFTETMRVDGDDLQLVNLIGEVQMVRGSGDEYEIEINVRGADASRDVITIERTGGRDNVVRVVFPVDTEKSFVYPKMGRSKSTISFNTHEHHNDSFWSKVVGAVKAPRIKVSGKGRGMEVWADVIIKVPRGKSANTKLGVGEIIATGIEGDIVLDISSGRVSAEDIKGSVVGDTGSGSVTFKSIRGKVNADTGSGSVHIEDCKGSVISADTGSGSVMVKGVDCTKLDIDTGSGRVKALDVKTDSARIDTGSGSIVLELKEMGNGKFVLDTGSGSIDLILPSNASARVSCDTGSGGIDVDLDGVNIGRRNHNDDVNFTVGDGDARVIMDTGSGGITVRQ
jgi:lia operon protein LiaG